MADYEIGFFRHDGGTRRARYVPHPKNAMRWQADDGSWLIGSPDIKEEIQPMKPLLHRLPNGAWVDLAGLANKARRQPGPIWTDLDGLELSET